MQFTIQREFIDFPLIRLCQHLSISADERNIVKSLRKEGSMKKMSLHLAKSEM